MRIVTMGVYGFDAASFRAALEQADIDLFVDIRRRRGVRGHEYAFANSNRLQDLLAEIGISYVHRIDLAPSEETRQAQYRLDAASGIKQSTRVDLSDAFKRTYADECLDHLDAREFASSLGSDVQSILLFCVEQAPTACHRSLLANKLAADLGRNVEHILP